MLHFHNFIHQILLKTQTIMGLFDQLRGNKNQANNTVNPSTLPEATISESMYSSIHNLREHPAEIMLRVHPSKKAGFDAIVQRNATVKQGDQEIKIVDKNLILNDLDTNERHKVKYSSVCNTEIDNFIDRKEVSGFDSEGEPFIYTMKDGTVRVLFNQLPIANNAGFDLDEYSDAFINAMDTEMLHDDREIFHIAAPCENTVSSIQQFLSTYT